VSGTDLDTYLADVRARPLVVDYRWPRSAPFLSAVGGVLLGSGAVNLFLGPLWWALTAIALGLLVEAVWWFAITSPAACDRRYERARIAAIHERYRELGIKVPS
jgi:hypothetical protein